ncbi:MAG: hypothetical protein AAFX80_23425, partial [Cyanobacteria bacterium J06639_18]
SSVTVCWGIAAKLGFKRAIVPKGQKFPELDIEILPVAKVIDAIIAAIPQQTVTEEDLKPDDDGVKRVPTPQLKQVSEVKQIPEIKEISEEEDIETSEEMSF